LRQTSSILFIAIDEIVPSRGNFLTGFDEFSASLDHAGIPAVWVSSRTRLQLDDPRRKLANSHPFIAEDGCGVYLPSDYFHLRPETSRSRKGQAATVRLGRYTCLPIAEPQPAAFDALEALAEESNVSVVPFRSLSPREAAQNADLPPREAELARQRDFDELFFFVGSSTKEIERFQNLATSQKCQVRRRGSLWSLAAGASLVRCVRELSTLYNRALHSHVRSVGLAVQGSDCSLFSACDRAICLQSSLEPTSGAKRVIQVPPRSRDTWETILEALSNAHHPK
jgi:mannosyl-3-phosphoglycerate phosphatase